MTGNVATPVSMSCAAVRPAWLLGMEKPRPMLPPTCPPGAWAMAEFMPTTSPRMLTRGPPELPGLIAASVWMALMKAVLAESPADTGRLSALMMPVVTVEDRPSGAPTATTCSPTWTSSESPKGRAVSPERSTRSTATS